MTGHCFHLNFSWSAAAGSRTYPIFLDQCVVLSTGRVLFFAIF